MPKDLKKILQEAATIGWRFERTNGGHIMAKHKDGVRIVYISSTPSDYRALANVKRDLGL